MLSCTFNIVTRILLSQTKRHFELGVDIEIVAWGCSKKIVIKALCVIIKELDATAIQRASFYE